MREIRTLRVTWRGPETELRRYLGAAAPVPDPTKPPTKPKPSNVQRKPPRVDLEWMRIRYERDLEIR